MRQNTFGIISYLLRTWNEFKMGTFKLICILDEGFCWFLCLLDGFPQASLLMDTVPKTVKPAEAPEAPMSF